MESNNPNPSDKSDSVKNQNFLDQEIHPLAGELDAGAYLLIGRFWRGVIKDPYQFTVFCMLKSHADNHTGKCFPGYKLLSEETGISRSQIIRTINQLQEKGLISVHSRHGEPNVYTVCQYPPSVRQKLVSAGHPPTSSPQTLHPSLPDTPPVPVRHPKDSQEGFPPKDKEVVDKNSSIQILRQMKEKLRNGTNKLDTDN